MDDHPRAGEPRTLNLQLDLHVDSLPITGQLRSAGGSAERFVGWLGFLDALRRIEERELAGSTQNP
jgi:hypothetical protein